MSANTDRPALLDPTPLPRFAVLCLALWRTAADPLGTAPNMPSVAEDIGG